MNLKNCRVCNRVFVDSINDVCPTCREKEEEDFKKVYEYLKEITNANIEEIHEQTGVDKQVINKFVREGRFESFREAGLTLEVECRFCGKPIPHGDHCKACSERLRSDIKGQLKSRVIDDSHKSRMHTAGRIKDRKKTK